MLRNKVVQVELKNGKKHPNVPLHGLLPWHEFSMGLIAPKGSGKTTLLCNFILRFYKGYFHKIVIFSPTIRNDEKWVVVEHTSKLLAKNIAYLRFLKYVRREQKKKVLMQIVQGQKTPDDLEKEILAIEKFNAGPRKIEKKYFIADYNQEILQELVDQRQKQIEFIEANLPEGKRHEAKFYADRVLMIFDDLVGSNLFSNRKSNNPFVELNTRHRHYSTSVLIVSQAYKEIPKTIRTNMTGWLFFRISNQNEINVIYEENPCHLPKDQWLFLYNTATEKPHDFLYMNHFFPHGEKMYRCFEAKLNYKTNKETFMTLMGNEAPPS